MTNDSGSTKNPGHEAEKPSPSPDYIRNKTQERGANTQTDERGRKHQNPEGQQGAVIDPATRA
jgi:hypothetical protein